ncbi:hypothetical protein [Cupriavidus sp. H18C2]|uniref:hypothetical protein n=1 Tax=Cupriavidus sp. H18C2 TaxID=3241602 RepID=UPI003BF819C0
MSEKLKAANRTAQLHYRGTGNPASVLPRSAISNCFPGLETDFRNLWRRTFEGIVLLENNNYVVAAEDKKLEHLVGHRLLKIDGLDTVVVTHGPAMPASGDNPLGTGLNPDAVAFMEWSNSVARILAKQGQIVECIFTAEQSKQEALPKDDDTFVVVKLKMRNFLVGDSAAISSDMLQPGELTHGLCSPWQNDYRECACYYWAASRPDFVNIDPGAAGQSSGDTWMAKGRSGTYIPDDRVDPRLLTYDDLFKEWESQLRFVVRGRDVE